MYKFKSSGWEKDHERWEEVDADEQCEGCGELNRHCQCSETADEEPVAVKSFHEKYGYDERDGPQEEEDGGCEDDHDDGPQEERRYK